MSAFIKCGDCKAGYLLDGSNYNINGCETCGSQNVSIKIGPSAQKAYEDYRRSSDEDHKGKDE